MSSSTSPFDSHVENPKLENPAIPAPAIEGAARVNIFRKITIDEDVDNIMLSTGAGSRVPYAFDVQDVHIKAKVRNWTGQMVDPTVQQLSKDYVEVQRMRLSGTARNASTTEETQVESAAVGETEPSPAATEGAQADPTVLHEAKFAPYGSGYQLGRPA